MLLANTLGYLAFDVLSASGAGCVVGKTTRGLFIRPVHNRILFISGEPYRSPLTININDIDKISPYTSVGTQLEISSTGITIPESNLRISYENAKIWRAPLPPAPTIPQNERTKRLASAGEKIIQNSSKNGLAPLIPLLINASDQDQQVLDSLQSYIYSSFLELRSSNWRTSLEFFTSVLGIGTGLTPSGDDFILGFLLALNRWGNTLLPGYNPMKLNGPVVEAACRKTTTLSANLIECAAQGQGDERLVAALDWLMSGPCEYEFVLDDLLKWGNSSGVDVFIGFIFALSFQDNLADEE